MKTSIFVLLCALFYSYYINFNYSCDNYVGYSLFGLYANCTKNLHFNGTTDEIIAAYGKKVERHQVQTEDGYILSLFRIPQNSPKETILLQHCFFYDSRVWVAQKTESIAFLYWQMGYEVWLGNFRGTIYSQKHTKYNVDDEKFWNFTLKELGYFDNKAIVDYIVEKTKRKIIYMGFSLGGTSGLIYGSLRPESTENIQAMVLIAPPTFVKNANSIFYSMGFISNIYKSLKYHRMGLDSWIIKTIHSLHKITPWKKLLLYAATPVTGFSVQGFDPQFINEVFLYFGSDTSTQLFDHLVQLWNLNPRFQMYDYGNSSENFEVYQQHQPPQFPIKNFKIPIVLVSSLKDSAVPTQDVKLLDNNLPDTVPRLGKIELNDYSHIDFLFRKNRNKDIYERILHILENSNLE